MTRKNKIFEGCWFKFTRVAKELKLKVKKFWGLILRFAEVTGEKLVGRGLFSPFPLPPYILNTVIQLIQSLVGGCCKFQDARNQFVTSSIHSVLFSGFLVSGSRVPKSQGCCPVVLGSWVKWVLGARVLGLR